MGAVSVQPSIYFLSLFRKRFLQNLVHPGVYNNSMNYQDYSVFVPVTELSRGLPEIAGKPLSRYLKIKHPQGK